MINVLQNGVKQRRIGIRVNFILIYFNYSLYQLYVVFFVFFFQEERSVEELIDEAINDTLQSEVSLDEASSEVSYVYVSSNDTEDEKENIDPSQMARLPLIAASINRQI
jgi:hypothetical protein